ncbi:MAG: hypothetical protein AB7F89_07200 [Pirellulaceae bacterium]
MIKRHLTLECLESRAMLDAQTELVYALPEGEGTPRPDFHLIDLNPASSRSGQAVSPRDYLDQVSAWYFAHAT